MRVMITGGAGLIGRAIATHLLERGDEVHLTDLAPTTDAPHTTYARCEVTDYAAVSEQVRGCDAVVHMAALRSPMYDPGQEVYRINTVGTFNIFEAAAQAGIRRVVQASSINAIGCAWNIGDFRPQYFPVDEDHPVHTIDPYSFSKQQSEEIGAYFWRRDRVSSVAMRFPGVYASDYPQSPQRHERRASMRRFLDELLTLSEDERNRRLFEVRERALAYRAERALEFPKANSPLSAAPNWDEVIWRAYALDRFNLWASLDVGDAAYAVELALTASFEGSHPLFINDSHNFLDYRSEVLANLFFPDVTQRKKPLTGSQALVSIDRARDLIGFEPRYSLYGAENVETG